MRSAFVSLLIGAALASACATSPPPMPRRRVAFAQVPAGHVPRAPDLQRPTEAPIVHERYMVWTLLADAASIAPLTIWMSRPDDIYLAMPALLLPPLIHLVHGESKSAFTSLFMRVAMLGGVYLAGRSAEAECADADFICLPIGSLLLAELAIIPVMTIDSIFLARRARTDENWLGLPVQPSLSVSGDGRTTLSLGGRF